MIMIFPLINVGIEKKRELRNLLRNIFVMFAILDLFNTYFRLSNPSINSSNKLIYQIEENKTKRFSATKTLKEIQNIPTVQTHINEETSNLLNYRLHENKYKDLISIDVDEKDLIKGKAKPRLKPRYKPVVTEKPDVFEFWEDMNYVTETAQLDLDVNLEYKEEEDRYGDFDFLFSLYELQEVRPFQKER